MAGKGGARPGAGRKPKLDKRAGAIDRAEKHICDHLPELIDLAFVRARGFKAKAITPDGEVEYYDTPPELKAIMYLVDRVMGKPMERHEFRNISDEDLLTLWRAKGPPGRNGAARAKSAG